MNSNYVKRNDFTKSVEYDDKEDIYYVKSATAGERYINLKITIIGFAHVKGTYILLETPRNVNIPKGLELSISCIKDMLIRLPIWN